MNTVYTYILDRTSINLLTVDDLTSLVERAANICLTISNNNVTVKNIFLYDPIDKLLHTSRFSGMSQPLFSNPVTCEKLMVMFEYTETARLSVTTYVLLNREDIKPSTTDIYKDYSQMITILAANKVVMTSTYEAIFSDDNRRFRFIKDLTNADADLTDEHDWTVDCLGTTLCANITHRVEDAYNILSLGL